MKRMANPAVVIRNPKTGEKEDLLRLQAKSFGKDVPYFRRIWDTDPRHSDSAARLILENGRKVGYLRYAPWKMHIRGQVVRFGGLAEVCTLPEVRGRGYLRLMMGEILADHMGKGFFINLLHGDPNLYRRFGWETACDFASASKSVSELRFPRVPGRVRPFRHADLPALMKLYAEKAGALPIMVARDEIHWRGCILAKLKVFDTRPWIYQSSGGIEGYAFVKTTKKAGGKGRNIHFAELTVRSMNAAWALVSHACRGAKADGTLTARGPGGLLPPATSPWGGPGAEIHVWGGSMARLVDAQGFINELGPAVGGFSGKVVIQVQDPFPFLHREPVEIRGSGLLRAQKTTAGRKTSQLRVGVGSLSQLVLGYKGAGDLAGLGLLKGPAAGIEKLAQAFPPKAGYQEELDDY